MVHLHTIHGGKILINLKISLKRENNMGHQIDDQCSLNCCSTWRPMKKAKMEKRIEYWGSETLEHRALNRMCPSNPSPQSSGNCWKKSGRKVRVRGHEGHQENRPSESTKRSWHELTETGTCIQPATGVYGVLCIYVSFSLECLWDSRVCLWFLCLPLGLNSFS